MTDDIVIRLRDWVLCDTPTEMVMLEAADEIERLRTEIRRLQGILGDVLGERDHWKWSATGNE